jgi:hypothetical protein
MPGPARPGPRTITRYTDHFKATAVRLSELPGASVGDVAQSLRTLRLSTVSLAQVWPRRELELSIPAGAGTTNRSSCTPGRLKATRPGLGVCASQRKGGLLRLDCGPLRVASGIRIRGFSLRG